MKLPLSLIAFLAASVSPVFGASIWVTSLVDTQIISSTGMGLGINFKAKVGVYSGDVGQLATSIPAFADIASRWTQAGEINFASGAAAGYNGFFEGNINFTDSLGIGGKPVWVWITDGATTNALLMGTAANQRFLRDVDIPHVSNFNIDSGTIPSFNLYGAHYDPTPQGEHQIGVLVVPEPSSLFLFAVLGGFCSLRRKRGQVHH